MITRLLVPIALAGALLACGDEDEAPLPERTDPPPATSLAATAPASPRGMTAADHWFRGVVVEMNTGCYVDTTCSVTVEVTESLGGAPVEVGTQVEVIESYGFSTVRCDGQWSETPPGREVEVLAHAAEGGSLAVCNGEHYFVKDLEAPE